MNMLKTLIEIVLFRLSGLFRRRDNRIIFGSWAGEKYSDNSRYMIEFLSGYSNKKDLVWIGEKKVEKEVPVNIKFVSKNSLKAIYYCLTAKYIFITHSYYDISNFNIFKGAKIIQLWHGIGIKRLGIKSQNNKEKSAKLREKVRAIIRNYDYFICSSEMNKSRNLIAFESYGINESNVINSGQPRNDYIIKSIGKSNYQLKRKISKIINEDIADKKIVLYLPTFRKYTKDFFTFSDLDGKSKEKIISTLSKYNAILIEKNHKESEKGFRNFNERTGNIYNLSNAKLDTQELLLASDILITDYSSCYLDFLILNRPIIHFAYDYQSYQLLDQGLYYDLDEIAAGDVVETFDELLKSLCESLDNSEYNIEVRKVIKEKMLEYENGNSCEIIARNLKIID